MNSWFSHFQWWLIDFQLAATLLLGAALLGARCIRQPAQRVTLGWAVSLALALLCLAAAIPAWARFHTTDHIQERPMIAVKEARPSERLPELNRALGEASPAGVSEDSPALSGPARQQEGQRVTETKAVLLAAGPWLSRLFVFASATMCLWLLVGMLMAAWLCRTAQGASTRLYEQLRSVTGPKYPPPRLLLSPHVPNAVALGIRRPAILLPAALAEQADEKSLRAVLAHEVAHIRNHDLWLLGLVRALLIVLFPNPLYWAMRACIRMSQEALADAVAAENRSDDYADGLIEWMRHVTSSKRVLAVPVVGIWEKPSELSKRINMLIDQEFTVETSVAQRWRTGASVFVGTAAVGLSLFSVRPASAGDGSLGIDLLKQSEERQSEAASFVCDITDNIRRETTPYFRRTLPDGSREISAVLSMKPFRVYIQNRQGFWMVTQGEAVNSAFASALPSRQKALFDLEKKNLGNVTIKVEGQNAENNVDCQVVEANLSDRFTWQLAEEFKAKHKSSRKLSQDPQMDVLQFIAKRRLFWIGKTDHLLYRYREYDGNGDLLSDISFSGHVLGGTIPDDVFAVPKDLKTFTAFTPQQFQKHEADRVRERQWAAWQNAFGNASREDSSGQTKAP